MENPVEISVEEEWRTVYTKSFDAYEVSSLGRVRRRGTEQCLVLWIGPRSYTLASLYKSKNVQAKIPVHRLVSDAFMVRPENDKVYIHHIDGNNANNAASNLRFVPAGHNALTRHKMRAAATSKFKGVCWCHRYTVWQGFIVYDNRRYHLGTFDSEVEAALAYNRKVRELTDDPLAVLNDV